MRNPSGLVVERKGQPELARVHLTRTRVAGLVLGVLDLADELLHQRVRDAKVEFVAEVDAAGIRLQLMVFGE